MSYPNDGCAVVRQENQAAVILTSSLIQELAEENIFQSGSGGNNPYTGFCNYLRPVVTGVCLVSIFYRSAKFVLV